MSSRTKRPGEAPQVPLYGQAEAIRVLYQSAFIEEGPPKPPRPRGRRSRWLSDFLASLTAPLHDPAGAKA